MPRAQRRAPTEEPPKLLVMRQGLCLPTEPSNKKRELVRAGLGMLEDWLPPQLPEALKPVSNSALYMILLILGPEFSNFFGCKYKDSYLVLNKVSASPFCFL